MPSLRTLFRPSKPRSKSAGPQSRSTWSRLRRIRSASTPLNHKRVDPRASVEDVQALRVESRENDQTGVREDAVDSKDDQHGSQILEESEPARKSNDASSLSQSQHGSKRLKSIMARFRPSRSQDQSSASEAMLLPESQDAKGPATTTDPVKKDNPPQTPYTASRDGQEKQREVSAQTAVSQESNHSTLTVCRHPSQRSQSPIQESQSEWILDMLNFDKGGTHFPEPSDPFSDGKDVELRRIAHASSKYSGDQDPEQPGPSSRPSHAGSTRSPSHKSQGSSRDKPTQRSSRTSSGSSRASRSSRISRLDPSKAAKSFNALAKKSGLPLSIDTGELSTGHSGDGRTSEDSEHRRRYRFLTRVRPVQSTLTLNEASQPAISKLRRTKTFANLTRRPDPMSALRGRTLETLSRLGGHSFLMLPADLAPAPLQLPACMVATMQYLRKFGPAVPELFNEPGDIKAATRLYDHFASQVLSAEKEEPKIAMTMRVIAMPTLEDSDPTMVLSVGWVLKALLAGLPHGILGSVRLYRALAGIFRSDLERALRVRLATLAIVALTSEMQCALICAVFALLAVLFPVQRPISPASPEPEHADGNPVRPVAHSMSTERALMIFGPLLLGTSPDRDKTSEADVHLDSDEILVIGLVWTYWRDISRQLRAWASL